MTYSSEAEFQRGVEYVHRCGPRVIYELLCELGRGRMCRTAIEELVCRYTAISPETHRMVGSDRFPPPPIRRVA